MRRHTTAVLAAATIAGAAAAGSGIAAAGGGNDSEAPITGSAASRATAAALQHTGGGRVTGTEVGDEESYYEVEVTRDDGTEVDVQLDEGFTVVGATQDRDTAES